MKKKSTRDLVMGTKGQNHVYVPKERPRLEIRVPQSAEMNEADKTPVSQNRLRQRNRTAKVTRRRSGEKKPVPALLKSKIFWGCVSLAMAALLAFVVMPLVAAKNSEMVTVIAASRDIPEGAKIERTMLQQIEICKVDLPQNAIIDTENALGKYTKVTILAGDMLTTAKVGETYFEDTYLYDLPEGKMAMSVDLADLAQSVSGKIRGGDVVRIYAVLEQNNEASSADDYSAELVDELQYVEVLAVTNNNVQDIRGSESQETDEANTKDSKTIATVTLLVNHQQARVLAGLNENATLYAALIVRGDNGRKETLLECMDNYLESLENNENAESEGGDQ